MKKISKSEVKKWLWENKEVLPGLVEEINFYTYKSGFDNLVFYENDNEFFQGNFDDFMELLEAIESNCDIYYTTDDYVKIINDGDLKSLSEDEYFIFLLENIDVIVDELIKCREDVEIPWDGLYEALKLYDDEDDDGEIVIVE